MMLWNKEFLYNFDCIFLLLPRDVFKSTKCNRKSIQHSTVTQRRIMILISLKIPEMERNPFWNDQKWYQVVVLGRPTTFLTSLLILFISWSNSCCNMKGLTDQSAVYSNVYILVLHIIYVVTDNHNMPLKLAHSTLVVVDHL